jgi:hypothetical protein
MASRAHFELKCKLQNILTEHEEYQMNLKQIMKKFDPIAGSNKANMTCHIDVCEFSSG